MAGQSAPQKGYSVMLMHPVHSFTLYPLVAGSMKSFLLLATFIFATFSLCVLSKKILRHLLVVILTKPLILCRRHLGSILQDRQLLVLRLTVMEKVNLRST